MSFKPALEEIIASIDESDPIELKAQKLKKEMLSKLKELNPADFPKAGELIYDYLFENNPRLAHMLKYEMNKPQSMFFYEDEETSRRLTQDENFPEYGEMARWRIQHILGMLPLERGDYAEKELAIRILCKHYEERDKKINWQMVDGLILELFDDLDALKTPSQQLHNQANEMADKLIEKEVIGKSKGEKYLSGRQQGYTMAKQDHRFSAIVEYNLQKRLKEKYDYGSYALNRFMYSPDTYPEYQEKSFQYIEEALGERPFDDPLFMSNELAIRILIRNLELEFPSKRAEYGLKEQIKRLFSMPDDDQDIPEQSQKIIH